jgi:hypothetical protein
MRREAHATMGVLKKRPRHIGRPLDNVRFCKRHQFASLNQLRDNDEAVFPKIDRRGGLLCLAVDLGNALRGGRRRLAQRRTMCRR